MLPIQILYNSLKALIHKICVTMETTTEKMKFKTLKICSDSFAIQLISILYEAIQNVCVRLRKTP